jgi:outer membrane protein
MVSPLRIKQRRSSIFNKIRLDFTFQTVLTCYLPDGCIKQVHKTSHFDFPSLYWSELDHAKQETTILIKKLFATAALVGASAATQAVPILKLDVGAGAWMPDYSGEIGNNLLDIDNLNLSDDTATMAYLDFDFPLVPLIPSIRIKHTELSTDGVGSFTETFDFADRTFDANAELSTDLDLTHTDYTLYYGLPEFYLDVDFGLTLRQFSGEGTVVGEVSTEGGTETQTDTVDLDVLIPMLFADVRLDLPLTGLYARAEGHALSIGDNSLTDFTAVIGYNFDAIPLLFDLELEAGYRSMDLELDAGDTDLEADVSIRGPYIGLQLKF